MSKKGQKEQKGQKGQKERLTVSIDAWFAYTERIAERKRAAQRKEETSCES
jgi:hypothetical protein